MAVGLIADLHDNLSNLQHFFSRIRALNLSELWLAGDIGSPETYAAIAEEFSGTIRAVLGNLEQERHTIRVYRELSERYSHLILGEEPLSFTVDNFLVTLSHHRDSSVGHDQARNSYIFVFGHTHQPYLKREDETWFVNPGTLAGIFTPATYALCTVSLPDFRLHRLYEPDGIKYKK